MIEQEEKEISREKQLSEIARCYKRVAMTDDGKKMIEDLEKFCGFNRSSVLGSLPEDRYNISQTMFREGMRNVYLHIKNQLDRNTGEK
jgi:hypothetical protein